MTRTFLAYFFRGDKRGEFRHFAMCAILTLSLFVIGVPALIAGALAWCFGFILECMPFNSFSLWDVAYNTFGCVFAVTVIIAGMI